MRRAGRIYAACVQEHISPHSYTKVIESACVCATESKKGNTVHQDGMKEDNKKKQSELCNKPAPHPRVHRNTHGVNTRRGEERRLRSHVAAHTDHQSYNSWLETRGIMDVYINISLKRQEEVVDCKMNAQTKRLMCYNVTK